MRSKLNQLGKNSMLSQILRLNQNRDEATSLNFECSACKDRGYIVFKHDGSDFIKECPCFAPKRIKGNIKRSGISEIQKDLILEKFQTDEPWQRVIKEAAYKFVDCKESKWFFVGGQVGSGKTHICIGILLELIHVGEIALMMHWGDVSTKLKRVVNDFELYSNEVDKYKKIDILCIDDFLKTEQHSNPTAADIRIAYEIIDYRYRNNLTTIINSEKSINKILELDEGIGSRVRERSIGFCVDIAINPLKNFRIKGGT